MTTHISQDIPTTPRACISKLLQELHEKIPFALWMVTRTDQEDWIVLLAEDHGYGVDDKSVLRWSDSFCSRMVRGLGPNLAPDAQSLQVYATAPIGQQIDIGAYIGFPLHSENGELFGTLCAVDPHKADQSLINEYNYLSVMAGTISQLLRLEELLADKERESDLADLSSQQDILGAFTSQALTDFLENEEERSQVTENTGGVIYICSDAQAQIKDSDDTPDQDVSLTRKLYQWTTRWNGFLARLDERRHIIVLPSQNEQQVSEYVTELDFRMKRILPSHAIRWGMRSIHRSYPDTYAALRTDIALPGRPDTIFHLH